MNIFNVHMIYTFLINNNRHANESNCQMGGLEYDIWSIHMALALLDQHTILANFLHILMHQPHAPAPGLVFIYVTGHKTLHFLFATFLSMLNLWSFHYFFSWLWSKLCFR